MWPDLDKADAMIAILNDFKPDNSIRTPLHLQLSTKLAAAIRNGVWQLDEALPSERTLSDQLGISRVTARKAFNTLCERGLLSRKRGSGTFITPALEQPLLRLTHFSEELPLRGFAPGSRWLMRERAMASSEEILALGLSPNAMVSRLKRLRTADGVVMAIECSTIPGNYLADPGLVTDSLYAFLDAQGTSPNRALQHIRAVNATASQARQVGIKTGTAMLFITRIGYLADGHAIELTHSYCRSDYYDFVAELFR